MKSVLYVNQTRDNGVIEQVPVFLPASYTAGKGLALENGSFSQFLTNTRDNANGDTAVSASGYQIVYDTLTYIFKQVIKQKFYEVPPAEFIPINVGEGAYANTVLTTYETLQWDDFEGGFIATAKDNAPLSGADAQVHTRTDKLRMWTKRIPYSLLEVNQALLANNWDVIEARQRSLKKGYDLGLQKAAFLGSGSTDFEGLLINTQVPINTSVITKYIKLMTADEFSAFLAGLITAYQDSCRYTVMPDTFLIPTADYIGLTVPTSASFPIVNKLSYMTEALRTATGNPNFEVKHVAYANADKNTAGKNIYMLYRRNDNTSLRMDIPIPYTVLAPGTIDNLSFTQTVYSQISGVRFLRPLESLQFRWS